MLAEKFNNWQQKARESKKDNKRFLSKAKHKRGMEKRLPELHEEAFADINCLDCANCCKTISPRFKTPDLKKAAKYLGIKESTLIEEYLQLDEEGDYVVKSSPCPFLGEDNYCSIYHARPGDCRNYPYTDSGKFFKYAGTTLKNSTTCPAVYTILEKLRQIG